ncbi:UTP--glucose-1-phosphate uridylyltransferase GalU [Pelistega sp. NLN82]|uniref:UTP--glucose-1-phosphate uridylyltransferase n=1 Tax=Pelistega ratti TaxID=2652177 RepID=A0A6L9Y6F0_9BURK|nr:UTP--glucose-1-phosphate uridylyltransferase GalU [Pelistega ratti]NEN75368.1 UTP--glucose-1-phosphate uridylyltransferase GalU [Pelistega ratti]
MLKAVIPVAGLGTRMLPATKAIPKEMLTLADKPLIQYIVEECIAAGIKEIILVNHASKTAVENHFDTHYELKDQLERKGKTALLAEIQAIKPADVSIISVRQGTAKGLGHAVYAAYPVVGDNPFAVLLPDMLVDEIACNPLRDNLAAMIARYQETGFSQILVEPVPEKEVDKYGVVDCGGAQLQAGQTAKMTAIVEKPPIDKAPSNLAVIGRYVFSKGIWSLLAQTKPGVGGEIQLTDAIAALMKVETVEAAVITGKSYDCGDKLGYAKAFVDYALRHGKIGKDFEQWLKTRV